MKKYISRNDLIYVAGHKGMAGSSIIRSFNKQVPNYMKGDDKLFKIWFLPNTIC